MSRKVMIVTGEASGDLHGARLVTAMRKHDPGMRFCGMGGREMGEAGVELLYDAARIAVVGISEVISHGKDIFRAQRTIRRELVTREIDLLILIDLPDFNLLLARKAKRLGIPVFYYISPQVWAWRSGRVKTIGRLVDRLGVILPFEQDFYRARGIDATYVGHPLLDSVVVELDREMFCRQLGIDGDRKLVGILPGSRIKELKRLLPTFLAAAARFQAQSPDKPIFLIPCASTLTVQDIRDNGVAQYEDQLDIRIVSHHRYDLMAACEVVIAASGTVTLELLLLNTPMVVAYKLSHWSYTLGRLLVKLDWFSLVNLIAGRAVVPELLQDDASPQRIGEHLFRLVYDAGERLRMLEDFVQLRQQLGTAGASDRAAALALDLLAEDEL